MQDSRELIKNYQRQLDSQFQWLRFDSSVEDEFRDSHFQRLASFMRMGQILGVVLYAGFAIFKLVAGPLDQYLLITTLLRLVIIGSLLCMFVAIGRLPHQRLQHVIAGNYLIFAIALGGIAGASVDFTRDYRYEGIIFAVFHCALFGCLLFRHCLFTMLSMLGIFVIACAALQVPGRELAYQTLFIALSIMLAAFSRYQAEYAERDGFLRRRIMSLTANFDGLTGLASRPAFDRYLRQYLRQNATGQRQRQAVILVDIDHFKQLNDSRGHDTGDKCLQLVAEVLKHNVDGQAQATARWGGDELIAVIPVDDEPTLEQRVEQIRRDVEQLKMDNPGSPYGRLTVSLGCALIAPEQRLSESVIFSAADAALYEAKQNGRNCSVVQPARAPELAAAAV